jgi:hypothetical protein
MRDCGQHELHTIGFRGKSRGEVCSNIRDDTWRVHPLLRVVLSDGADGREGGGVVAQRRAGLGDGREGRDRSLMGGRQMGDAD